MPRPAVTSWVEQADALRPDGRVDLLRFAAVAERTGPDEVVEVIWTTRQDPPGPDGEVSSQVLVPRGWRHHVIDLEAAFGRQEAILAGIACPDLNDDADEVVVWIVLRLLAQLSQDPLHRRRLGQARPVVLDARARR